MTMISCEFENNSDKMYGSFASTHPACYVNLNYLRPKKAAWLKRMYNTPFTEKKALSLWQGKNATIFPLRKVPGDDVLFGRGGVVDESGNYVALSGIEKRIKGQYPFENSVYRDEKVCYCGYLANHWGHFLVEAGTPRRKSS